MPHMPTWLFHTAERIEREHTHTARVAAPHLAQHLSRGWGDLKDSHAALHRKHFALERARLAQHDARALATAWDHPPQRIRVNDDGLVRRSRVLHRQLDAP